MSEGQGNHADSLHSENTILRVVYNPLMSPGSRKLLLLSVPAARVVLVLATAIDSSAPPFSRRIVRRSRLLRSFACRLRVLYFR